MILLDLLPSSSIRSISYISLFIFNNLSLLTLFLNQSINISMTFPFEKRRYYNPHSLPASLFPLFSLPLGSTHTRRHTQRINIKIRIIKNLRLFNMYHKSHMYIQSSQIFHFHYFYTFQSQFLYFQSTP